MNSAHSQCSVFSVAADRFGNSYVTGHCSGLFIQGDTFSVAGFMILKFNVDGILQWAKTCNGGEGHSLAVDSFANVYVTGVFTDSVFIIDSTILNNQSNPYKADLFLMKYDSSGNLLWARSAGGTLDEFANSVVVDNKGGVYVAGGYTSPSISFGATTLSATGIENFFIAKYDTSGNPRWAKTSANSGDCAATSLATGLAGDVYFILSGIFRSLHFNPFLLIV